MNKEAFGLITKDNVLVPLTGVEVYSDITGRGARVKIVQIFRNAEEKAIEAVYKFPLPEQSAVCGFRATIGDRIIAGEIEEREKAFMLYDDALSQGDGAYLLDEERPNIFTLSAGNINLGSSVTIEIEYVILLDANSTEVRFFLPTTISPRYIPDNLEDEDGMPVDALINPTIDLNVPYGLKIHVAVHGKDGIASLESPSHTIRTQFVDNHAQIEFSADEVKMDRDFILTITYKDEFTNRAYIINADKESFISIDLHAGRDEMLADSKTSHKDNKEIIFVLDCSGSMDGSSIDEAKNALKILLKALEEGMMFNFYRFGSTFEKLFSHSMPYDKEYLHIALQYLSKTTASLGGTEMLSPMKDIYETDISEGFTRDIILITDGEISNESDVISLVQSNINPAKVFVIGIGHGPNEYFIKQIARSSHGASELIAPNERVEPKALSLYKKINGGGINNITIKTGLKIDQSPLSPVLFDNETISIFGKLQGTSPSSLPSIITITGVASNTGKTWSVPVQEISGDHIPISLLWAREKIRELEEGTALKSGSKQIKRKKKIIREQLIKLSKTYGLVSRETSFVAVEKREEKEKTLGEVILRKIPVMLTKDCGGIRDMFPKCYSVSIQTPPSQERDTSCSYYSCSRRDEDSTLSAFNMPKTTFPHRQRRGFIDILSLQRFEGGFIIDADLADMLSLPLNYISMAANKIVGKYKIDAFVLLSTAIILLILERRYANDRSIWETVGEKSIKWLEREIMTKKPFIDGIPLIEWVEDFLQRVDELAIPVV